MKDMKAVFTQEITVHSLRKTEREAGKFYFKNPLMMRWDYTLPKPKKLIINEKNMWLYIPEDGIVYIQNTGDALKSKTILKFLTGVGNIRDDFLVQYSQPNSLNRDGDYLLTLIPHIKDWGMERLFLTVDKSDLYIKEFSFTDPYGNSTRLAFKKIKINNELPLKLFIFIPPTGVESIRIPH